MAYPFRLPFPVFPSRAAWKAFLERRHPRNLAADIDRASSYGMSSVVLLHRPSGLLDLRETRIRRKPAKNLVIVWTRCNASGLRSIGVQVDDDLPMRLRISGAFGRL